MYWISVIGLEWIFVLCHNLRKAVCFFVSATDVELISLRITLNHPENVKCTKPVQLPCCSCSLADVWPVMLDSLKGLNATEETVFV